LLQGMAEAGIAELVAAFDAAVTMFLDGARRPARL
jgi:hypothetical protein